MRCGASRKAAETSNYYEEKTMTLKNEPEEVRAAWTFMYEEEGIDIDPSDDALNAYVKEITGIESWELLDENQCGKVLDALQQRSDQEYEEREKNGTIPKDGYSGRNPKATKHNPDPLYLRALIERTGLSQRECARRLGISERIMRMYISVSGKQSPAPYTVQFALECLADAAEVEKKFKKT
jgi:hypothetical protein